MAPNEENPALVVAAFDELLNKEDVDINTLTAYATALISRLRSFSREAVSRTTAQRALMTEARNTMDHAHLGLQNLLYERRHLEREIQKCRQFEFIYQDIPLYPLEEFAELVPGVVGAIDNHELMKKRLEFENSERARLEDKKKALIAERDKLIKEKREHRLRLESESREEAEFAKVGDRFPMKAAALDGILADLTLVSGTPNPSSS
ncbi:Fms-interacting protein-domain-containing protein [Cantharellus anzutake]|uniref:Fms-interacting protein-domain-containing protein n=1 Tax=Cantharellus anzutake TaxID=1750568 RepID=UPI001903DE12|nr:Fms-interacting protein-domain-containing protein [Cantharellus anzutake]KAF8341406.1 Fms-interacting protein-domain-containing protein [Cantharellus anzutake]